VTRAVTGPLQALAAGLRARGVRVGVGELLGAHRALLAVDAGDPVEARLALRAVLCARREDLAAFDAAFAEAFAVRLPDEDPFAALGDVAREALPSTSAPAPPAGERRPGERDALTPAPAAWSAVELLRERDFADMTDAEQAQARHVLERLARRGPTRTSRRLAASRRRSHQPDLRRTLRAALRHGGEPLERRWRAPTEQHRPLVLVCDVSGSMAPYARALLQYLHACVAARRRVEAFAFGTRLTRLTRELAGRDHEAALARACAAVVDWSGGTRIGAALAQLNRTHGRRLGRGAVVVVLSDGWDRGDPVELGAEMARLRRSAHRVIWLNPLAAHPAWAPLTQGMRAALPHTDHLLAGNSLRSLEDLAAILEEL
jgi:hypothetical protein